MDIKKVSLMIAISLAPLVSHASGFTGSYAGVQIGHVSGKDDGTEYFNGKPDGYMSTTKPKGNAYSIMGGYNWALNEQMLLGVDGDLRLKTLSASAVQTGGPFPWIATTKVKNTLSVRAKFGYVFNDKTMAYVAAGLANAQIARSYSGSPFNYKKRSGFTYGFGAEEIITDKISLSLNYRHTDFGTSDVVLAGPYSGNFERLKYKEQSLLLGAAYHF